MPTRPDPRPDPSPLICEQCGHARADVKYDRTLRKYLCNLCWAATRPAGPPPPDRRIPP